MTDRFILEVDGQCVFDVPCTQIEWQVEQEFSDEVREWGGQVVKPRQPISATVTASVTLARSSPLPPATFAEPRRPRRRRDPDDALWLQAEQRRKARAEKERLQAEAAAQAEAIEAALRNPHGQRDLLIPGIDDE